MSYSNDIEGNDRANVLRGTQGNDSVFGRGGDDLLLGRRGNDSLSGDEDDDRLVGGRGEDRFIFAEGGGDDTVRDFADGVDTLDVTAFGFAAADEVLALATQEGDDVVIALANGVSVTLQGVELASLDRDNFLI